LTHSNPHPSPPPDTLAELLRQEIAAVGVIPFTRFMQLALYHPAFGYYEQADPRIGRRGDYFTSVSVGDLFGRLLAFRFADWLAAVPFTPVYLVEAGAHDGRLAADILGWLGVHRRQLVERLEYWLLEPSPRRRRAQEAATRPFAAKVRWAADWTAFPPSGVHGIIFANELLDAFPVRRVGWDAGTRSWFEWGVGLAEGRLVWARMPKAAGRAHLAGLEALPPALLAVLPDGFTTDICPAAEAWWREAGRALRSGKLMTLDYGLNAEDFFSPDRPAGTLRAYHRHRAGGDLLAAPGEQDLTAHVDFTALRRAGEATGLQTEAYVSQGRFLTQVAARAWTPGSDFGAWTPQRQRQFQTLTHPDHLGERFRVLVQSR
jgi:SAM-dependent MidA family methyltransferase